MLGYFDEILNRGADESISDIYVPFTNANDFTTEVSLIPNTHSSLKSITSRAYYDMKYRKYRGLLKKHNILHIATFALVDPDRDKVHLGQYLVKVVRKVGESSYRYVVAKIDRHGQFLDVDPG